jgi:hypothetical protein
MYVPIRYINNMENIKKYSSYINEWLDSPGSVDIPGDAMEIRVNSRNYQAKNMTMPETHDAMFEAAEFYDFLDSHGKSEDFNKYIDSEKRSGSNITDHLKDKFKERMIKGKD